MMTTTSTLDIVTQSYGRCCTQTAFFDTFYDEFLKSSPEIAPMFANTDFVVQKQALRNGISMLISFSRGNNVIAQKAVERLSLSHNHEHLKVRPDLYPFWINSLLSAIRKHDPDYTPEIDKAWRTELQKGISFMIEHY